MKKILYYLLIYLTFCCCKSNKTSLIEKTHTVFPPSAYAINKESCKQAIKGFTGKYSVNLSRFYISERGTAFNKKDSVSIVKPFYTQINAYGNCFPEKSYGNLLLVYNHHDTTTKVYRNALYTDEPNVFQEIIPDKKGFIISAERGNSSKVISKVKISYKSGILHVDAINIESSGFHQYSKKYNFNHLNLERYSVKMIDSLQRINEMR